MTDKELMAEVQGAKEYLESLGYRVAYIWIYGSQNYGLAEYSEEYQSDIDFKAVIVPSLDDLVYNNKPKSTTLDYKWGQIDLKDVRVFIETLVKCNPAYVETLYTPYCIYSKSYEPIINEREQLVSEMGEFLLRACYGMIMEKVKAFSHPYPSIADKVEKFWYDPKQLHHIIRLELLMHKYFNDWVFDMSNTSQFTEFMLRVKKWFYSLAQAEEFRDRYEASAKWIRDCYSKNNCWVPSFNSKNRILQYSKDLVKESIISEIKKKSRQSKWDTYCPICQKKTHCKYEFEWIIECTVCWNWFTHLPNMKWA